MSANNIPFEIQEEIIKRVLPVKSLIRFRSVSKQWKSLIDSSEFITGHSVNNQNHQHRILLRYKLDSEYKSVSIVDDDDDSFPQHKFPLSVSPTIKLSSDAVIIGCSHGLVCLYGFDRDTMVRKKPLIVVWNPSIRKSVGIVLPYKPHAFGFGVCPKTFAPKIVIITVGPKFNYKAEVFTLTSGAWRSISMNLPFKPKFIRYDTVVVADGVIYWWAYVLVRKNDEELYSRKRIISFDLTSEEFGEVDLPESLSLAGLRSMDICKLKESLVVLDYYRSNDAVCDVWMKVKNGSSSFTKLFTVVKVRPYSIIGFRKNGQPIVDRMRKRGGYHETELQVYEPNSEHINGVGIYGSEFSMASYTESLLLLNHRFLRGTFSHLDYL